MEEKNIYIVGSWKQITHEVNLVGGWKQTIFRGSESILDDCKESHLIDMNEEKAFIF